MMPLFRFLFSAIVPASGLLEYEVIGGSGSLHGRSHGLALE